MLVRAGAYSHEFLALQVEVEMQSSLECLVLQVEVEMPKQPGMPVLGCLPAPRLIAQWYDTAVVGLVRQT